MPALKTFPKCPVRISLLKEFLATVPVPQVVVFPPSTAPHRWRNHTANQHHRAPVPQTLDTRPTNVSAIARTNVPAARTLPRNQARQLTPQDCLKMGASTGMIDESISGYPIFRQIHVSLQMLKSNVFQRETHPNKSKAPQILRFGRQVWENTTQEAWQGLTPIDQSITILMKNQLCVRMSFQGPAEGQPSLF